MRFEWVFSLIPLSGQGPHARCTPMWALSTCGEPNETDLTAIGVELGGSRRVPGSMSEKQLWCAVLFTPVPQYLHRAAATRSAADPSLCTTLNRHVRRGTLPRMA